jgi:hypothetical protein
VQRRLLLYIWVLNNETMRHMKKGIIVLAAASLWFAFSACEDLLNKVGVTINSDYTTIDFTVNPDQAGAYFETVQVVDSDLDSLIEAEGQNIGELNSVKIKEAGIQVMDGGNLDPFESFLITLEAPGKAVVTVAEVMSVSAGLTEIPLVNEEVDLTDYLESDQYTIKVKTVLDQDLETPRMLRAKVRFAIKVGL